MLTQILEDKIQMIKVQFKKYLRQNKWVQFLTKLEHKNEKENFIYFNSNNNFLEISSFFCIRASEVQKGKMDLQKGLT